MHIHILGICGTFMGGVAILARQAGYTVSGSDANVYPPMSTQLEQQGIHLMEGYAPAHLKPTPDYVVIGNALSRGNPAIEALLNERIPYMSGPQWLGQYILKDRWVVAVAGTHGKTTTSSMVAWILKYAHLNPGFLIGGIPANFGVSAAWGDAPFFVVEADEYDTAFFDKRSKFVHYQARTLIMNNLEYDHADIFPDLAAIQTQFHHLVRTVPGNGLIIAPQEDPHLRQVLKMGCWTPLEYFSKQETLLPKTWQVRLLKADGSQFEVYWDQQPVGQVDWSLTGWHNVQNALAALAAARHTGVIPAQAVAALNEFKNVKRRMELRGQPRGIFIYDDFAHHPTAISTTLEGLRAQVGAEKITVIMEPRSNTMRMGVYNDTLGPSFDKADAVYFYKPKEVQWDLEQVAAQVKSPCKVFDQIDAIVTHVCQNAKTGNHIIIMSNGGFGGIHDKLINALTAQ